MGIFKEKESNVRGYCRSFPVVFKKAKGAVLTDEAGSTYIDFLSGAGSLNYGHNNDVIKSEIIDYLESDGLLHGLDMHSTAKRRFIETFEETILNPRKLDYKLQFTGPTGTNAVEAALKLARKIKRRTGVVSFTNGFHGVTLGSVSTTGNIHYRKGSGVPLGNVSFMPYDGYLGPEVNTIEYFRKCLEDSSSGLELPAAVIVETVQGEGGVNVARAAWLMELQTLCREFDILLIVDDIQVGCGRTGTFFSFERAGIKPDIVTLSKSISAYGLPMALVLLRPDLDIWKPGEHNGTFRGHNLAFVAAEKAIRHFWSSPRFRKEIEEKARRMKERLQKITAPYVNKGLSIRGWGMIWGIDCQGGDLAEEISRRCFENGLIIETAGSKGHVLKCLPPLTIDETELDRALDILEEQIKECYQFDPKNIPSYMRIN